MIPIGWQEKTLGEFVSLQRGYDLTEQERKPGSIPVAGSSGINGRHNVANVKAPGVTIGRSGASFGVANYYTVDFWAHNTVLFVTDFHSNHELFAYYFLDYFDFASYNSGGAQPSLNRNFIYPIPIVVPPLSEQRKIAELLRNWDEAIDLTEQLIAAKQRRKQALMQRLLTGQVRFPRFVNSTERKTTSSLGDLPIDWEVVSQREVAKFFTGRAYKKSEWEESGTPVIRLQNLTGRGSEFYYSTLTLPEHQYCHKGDLLYMWSATFGPHIWQGDKAIYHYHIWNVKCSDKLHQKFLYFMLAYLTDSWMSNTNGMGLLHITKETMESLQIPLPSMAEQYQIADVLSKCDEELALHQQKLAALRRQKQGLMQQLLTGKIRVKG